MYEVCSLTCVSLILLSMVLFFTHTPLGFFQISALPLGSIDKESPQIPAYFSLH